MKRAIALLLAAISGSATAQQAAEVPGDAQTWFETRVEAAAPLAPSLADLREEALFRARWSTTIQPCSAPPENLRLFGLRPAMADRLVTNGMLADAFLGAWTFYAETDCAETPLLRYMYVLEKDGSHVLMVVNRGETIATPSMMRETSAVAGADAFAAAKARQPDCDIKSVGMRAARIDATDPGLGPEIAGTRFTGGWSEIWAFRACQQDVEVHVRFDTDGRGGTTARIQNTRVVG
ncbi:hypothetical protein KCG44_05440 [Pacificimonas sp. WHA3]|uniref:Uncharacterized protein n=1 Tax=Pacificimonas pallii TaxID=2827236 RepID=A0ABS6SD01_9SPHN|nr:hypothetical protein [Pacificimonas pallii]MBV7256225.1 hypothetical protein [Pacificimonas pallii]